MKKNRNPYKYFIHLIKADRLSSDAKRNMKVLIVACFLNFSFAIEKFCNVIGHQQNDFVWMTVYGGLGIYLAYIALYDYIHDVAEGHATDTTSSF